MNGCSIGSAKTASVRHSRRPSPRSGRQADAVIAGESALELDLEYDRARATLGWAYFLSGRKDEGLAELERALSSLHGHPRFHALLRKMKLE